MASEKENNMPKGFRDILNSLTENAFLYRLSYQNPELWSKDTYRMPVSFEDINNPEQTRGLSVFYNVKTKMFSDRVFNTETEDPLDIAERLHQHIYETA